LAIVYRDTLVAVSDWNEEYPEPHRRITVGDGLRFGFGFAMGVGLFWIALLALLVAAVLVRGLL
jgi:hypothetical protein